MNLQSYVTSVLEAAGAVVVPQEYALSSVLLPDKLASRFQGQTELLMAFDFEVAQENPGCEFVTFGSHVLNEAISLVLDNANASVRYAIVDSLTVANPVDKLQRDLQIHLSSLAVLHVRPVIGVWAVFTFRISYISDERREATHQVWVNRQNGRCDPQMAAKQGSIFYQDRPSEWHPVLSMVDLPTAFATAYQETVALAEQEARARTKENELQRELRRISEFYQELERENEIKSQRQGLTAAQAQALQAKADVLRLDKQKQLNEMRERYTIRMNIGLDHGIQYCVPLIEHTVRISRHGQGQERVVFYNPILKKFEHP